MVMKEIRGSIDIDAPIGRVWEVMTDFKANQQWNPFITEISGELKEGSTFEVTVKIPGRKDTNFKPKLVRMVKNKEMFFQGTIVKGLLSNEHLYTLESLGEKKTRLSQRIALKGLMSFFAGGMMRDSQKGLDMMNSAAKVRCESPGK
jgi:hypothetical protein